MTAFRRAEVHLGNWRTRPFSTWAFSHVTEIVPAARIRAGVAQPAAPHPKDPDFLAATVTLDRGRESVRSFLTRSDTDLLLVQRDGRMLGHWQAPHGDLALPHIVFSVTKSVTGLLCGLAQAMGLLDPARMVGEYLPDTRAGAYGDCPVRHLLDMRVGLDLAEAYLDPDSDYARYRRAMLWNPPDPTQPVEGLAAFLNSVRSNGAPHGGPFAYQSPNSDMLALVLDHVTGGLAEFATRHLWQPMRAADDAWITVDAFGAPRGAGGLCATARDMGRLGALLLDPGDVVPEWWVAQTWAGGDRDAWDSGAFHDFIPGGSYVNQWYRLPPPADALMAMGIHGQFVYVHRPTRTVIVKLGSQALPDDDALDGPNLQFLHQLAVLTA